MSKVYALFVGIDRYHAAPPLHGAVADIGAMEALLTERIPRESLELRTLRNDEATRAAIIDGFLSHLCEARADDIALFYFCGHGSQEPCPDEWRLESEEKNQTLVPVDARTGDVFDIADKELSALIHEVASRGPQVVVVTDSCHSGGNTRDDSDSSDEGDTARTAPASTMRPRVLGDYLELARTLYDPARTAEHGRPKPRHVAIAACQSDQTAKEIALAQTTRGAFSTAFEHAVRWLGPSATYVDLVNAVRTNVRSRVADQLPNLHVSGGASVRDVFLGGHSGRRNLTLDADKAGRWWLSSGEMDGIPLPTEGVTEIAVYERGALDAGAAQSAPFATGIVERVLEDRARLTVTGGPLDPSKQYVGAIIRQGTPALNVVIDAAAATSASVGARVEARLAGRSALFAVVDGAGARSAAPWVTLVVSDESVRVRLDDGTTIAGLQCAVDDAGLDRLAQACDHLARWYGLRDRAPAGSLVNGLVKIDIVPVFPGEVTAPEDRTPKPTTDGGVALQYDGDQPPRVQIRLRNTRLPDTSSFRLYVALLNLTDTFECAKWFGDWIPADGTALVESGIAIPMRITDGGARAATDYWQVVASPVEFDPERWNLPPLLEAEATRSNDEPEDEAIWGTSLLRVATTRTRS